MAPTWEPYSNIFSEIVGKAYVTFNDPTTAIKNLLV